MFGLAIVGAAIALFLASFFIGLLSYVQYRDEPPHDLGDFFGGLFCAAVTAALSGVVFAIGVGSL